MLLEAQRAEQAEQEVATVRMMFNGEWIPVKVDLATLRRAIGLPNHNVFAAGIFQSFTPQTPSHPEQQDVDHIEEDVNEDSDDGDESMV
ncbi:hypothetical protein PF005_g19744 [Phytophthora fragariae]|uniref:Uncharacterized protein n=2 Tax=Phytophthora fragariae TaxID=53985 RepID=A0A6A3WWR5_9STRA|nr:hypothetical protein PF003_g33405 [Phytophthora fragariae]KAE9189179.1 hypothetical protein PF005_g19744 [Phytophthora fragariae]